MRQNYEPLKSPVAIHAAKTQTMMRVYKAVDACSSGLKNCVFVIVHVHSNGFLLYIPLGIVHSHPDLSQNFVSGHISDITDYL